MIQLPEVVLQAWENREKAVILTTVNEQGIPNAIYATCASKYNDNTFVVADNYFDKTRKKHLSKQCRVPSLHHQRREILSAHRDINLP